MGKLFENRAFAVVGEGGRVVIPAAFRKALCMEPGTSLLIFLEEGELRIITAMEGIRRAQAIAAEYAIPGRSMVDELITERRAEAARE
ncbi:MAG: AbrB/MazE/SpoVT family DNA-binding domain-containing protein [Chloroflexi bacterium]|nr:AbrB/MazE/SpoVT family DNA-binding domain-containing protein [Chloroflexota bacterium]